MYKDFNWNIGKEFGFKFGVYGHIDTGMIAIFPTGNMYYTYTDYRNGVITREVSLFAAVLCFGISFAISKSQKMASND